MNTEVDKQNREQDEAWTVRRVLEWTTDHLQRHHCQTPRLDAEILLAHARGCGRIELYTRFDDVLSGEERGIMRDLVLRRANAEPVAYLVGHREFFSLDFVVTPEVFIPRPETEMLVMEALELARDMEAPRILEIGTGSGCIAIAVAANHAGAQLTAVDVSRTALEVAGSNAERHGVLDRIRFVKGDLYASLEPDVQFDLILSNPPYITERERETLQPDVRLHEPQAALFSGPDGLDLIRRMIAESAAYLSPGGSLLLEIAPEQASAVAELLKTTDSFPEIKMHKDISGQIRVVSARNAGTERSKV